LAEALRSLFRLDEAEQMARRALEIWETRVGPDHQWTGYALLSLGRTMLARRKATEAAQMAERAAQILTLVFGSEHADVRSALELQASALQGKGDSSVAEPPRSN
jgi:hypothetical protein